MITGSVTSLQESEAPLSSADFSNSTFSSALTASSERRCTQGLRRASGPTPPQSVDVTEKPHDGDNDDASGISSVASTSGIEDVGDSNRESQHICRSNSNTSSTGSSSGLRQNLGAQLGDGIQSDDEDQGLEGEAVLAVTIGQTVEDELNEASYSSSFTSVSTSRSLASSPPLCQKMTAPSPAAANADSDASFHTYQRESTIPDTLPETLLAALSQEQLESALQLYVDRGGIHLHEVPTLLATLPWCAGEASAGRALEYLEKTSALSHASLSSDKTNRGDGNGIKENNDSSPLLDPQGWLCAVAVATPSINAAPSVESKVKSAEPPTVSLTPFVSADINMQREDPILKDRYNRSTLEQSSGGSSSLWRDLNAVAPTAKNTPLCNQDSSAQPPLQQQEEKKTKFPTPPTPAKRKLAFDDEGATKEFADMLSRVEPRFSLPELPPRPPSSSLRSLLSQPVVSTIKSAQVLPTNSQSKASKDREVLNHSDKSRRPPRSSPPITSNLPESSVSPETQPLATTQGLRASSLSSTARCHSQPTAIAATLRTEEAGMRTLFQQCLCTPLAAATSMLLESDWVTLVEGLREEGHRKLPPQAILDDVTHTIAEEIRQGKQSGEGLNLSDFACIMHTQLDEVRRDLTLKSQSTAANVAAPKSHVLTDAAASVEFPAQPRYLLTLPTTAQAEAISSLIGSDGSNKRNSAATANRASLQRASIPLKALQNGVGWRVLPTWCMSLAGLFPLEMSTVCPVPVVRYLRSVGLMNAVLEALVQRAELEVKTMTTPMPTAAEAAAVSSFSEDLSQVSYSNTNTNASAPPPPQRQQQLKRNEVAPYSSAASSSTTGVASLVGMSGFIWPPRENALALFSVGGGIGTSSSGRPTSSVVITEESHSDGQWREDPVWQLAEGETNNAAPLSHLRGPVSERDAHVKFNALAAPLSVGDEQGGRGGRGGQQATAVSTSASISRRSSASRRYLEERPLDEISASVVARAKARRLMDSLRRNTVPINRYECFARVEHEDEAVQEPLCFVSKAELEKTLGGSDDDDDDTSQDSDAISDILKALTYDPSIPLPAPTEEEEGNKSPYGAGTFSEERMRVTYTNQYRTSVRPPQLPRISAVHLLPSVFGRSTRASVLWRTRASSAGAAQSSLVPTSEPRIVGLDARVSSACPSFSISGIHQRPPLPHQHRQQEQHHRFTPAPPPPPVPGMYRMTGVLLGALPKKQEEALVKRLSQPLCDPRAMSLRAASAAVTRPTSSPNKTRGSAQQADSSHRAQSAGVRPPRASPPVSSRTRPATSPSPRKKTPMDHENEHTSGTFACTSNARSAQAPQPSPPPPASVTAVALPSSSPSKAVSPIPHLTKEQSRGFSYFHVPPVLVADPLSTVAAATAMTQVLNSAHATPPPTATASPPGGGTTAPLANPFKTPAKLQPPRRKRALLASKQLRRGHAPKQHPSKTAPLLLLTAKAARREKRGVRPATRTTSAAVAAAAEGTGRSRLGAPRQASAQGTAQRCDPGNSHQQRQQGNFHHPTDKSPQLKTESSAVDTGEFESSATATPIATHRMYGTGHAVSVTTAFASEVPRTRQDHDKSEQCAAASSEKEGLFENTQENSVWLAVPHRNGFIATSSHNVKAHVAGRDGAPPQTRSPPPAATMSLYERRLLRKLQRAYMAERAVDE